LKLNISSFVLDSVTVFFCFFLNWLYSSHLFPSQEDYIHAPSMYNLPSMKNRKLKFGLGVFTVVGLGVAIPLVSYLNNSNCH